jgi:tRNA1Val (adenine37-N6)-methyltransferase
MSNNYFRFKNFTIEQDLCAMKVGTDGVLLGAISPVSDDSDILDVGTGTGLVAIMLAQRSNSKITAVELDESAARQAQINVGNCPWKDRIEIIQGDFCNYSFPCQYDYIVSNPPYFKDLSCADKQRNLARHTDSLTYENLIDGVVKLLKPQGQFSVIIPFLSVNKMIDIALFHDIYLSDQLDIQSVSNKAPIRSILTFGRNVTESKHGTLIIEESPGKYSVQFISYLHDYYINL